MRLLAALLLISAFCPALAQPGPHAKPGFNHPMPPPERRMSWEERERLREQVRSGHMTRDEARAHWRAERERRGLGPGRSPEERQKMRRDIQDANRDLEKR
jgi:hypothetical protein